MSRQDYMAAVDQVKEYIQAGDIFQLVLSHRFKRRTFADPVCIKCELIYTS